MLTRSARRLVVLTLAAVGALAVMPATVANAGPPFDFFEEAAEAFWSVPHTCADGSIVPGTLLVRSTRDYSAPDTEDADPTVRLQFLAVCPDGTSFSWGAPTVPATITSKKLKKVRAVGSGTARDIFGVTHAVTVDAKWVGVGPVEVINNAPGSRTRLRDATATAVVTFDGLVLANGASNHPTRPAPFIRVDTER
jgi:hypothetical protein